MKIGYCNSRLRNGRESLELLRLDSTEAGGMQGKDGNENFRAGKPTVHAARG